MLEDLSEAELKELVSSIRRYVPARESSTDSGIVQALLEGDIECQWTRDGTAYLLDHVSARSIMITRTTLMIPERS